MFEIYYKHNYGSVYRCLNKVHSYYDSYYYHSQWHDIDSAIEFFLERLVNDFREGKNMNGIEEILAIHRA